MCGLPSRLQHFAWVSCPLLPCLMWWFALLLSSSSTKTQKGGQEGIVLNHVCLQIWDSWLSLCRRPTLTEYNHVLVPIFLAVVPYCPLSPSVVPIAFLPPPHHRYSVLMLHGADECYTSEVGCYLRLHPHLEEVTPTCPLQLTVMRALMVLSNRKCWWLWRSPLFCSLSYMILAS